MVKRFSNLEKFLVDNKKKNTIKYNNEESCFENDKKFKYKIEDGIVDFFIDDNKLSKTQSDFYNKVQFPNYDNIDDFGTLLEKSEKSIFFQKLDKEIPNYSNVLEAGCGTGQLSLFLSRYERQIFSIDLSKGSLLLAEKFRKKNNIENVFFLKMSIFNLFFRENFFDIIISNGVLHHTHNPKLAFLELTKYLKKNGYIIIGLYHRYGRIFTNIRQFIIKHFGDSFKFLDRNTINKSSSEQKRFAWFFDQYKNPKESSHTFKEILKWFNEANIDFVSSIPFSFPNGSILDNNLFKKQEIDLNFKIYLTELYQCIIPHQIKEGGFFIMIGKKK